jgi:hypothetical protein
MTTVPPPVMTPAHARGSGCPVHLARLLPLRPETI